MVRRVRADNESIFRRGLRHIGLKTAPLWFSTPVHRLRLKGRHPLKLSGPIEPPFPGDETRGQDILRGKFVCRDQEFFPRGGNPWVDGEAAPATMLPWLHSFDWLADAAAAAGREDARATRRQIEAIVGSWLQHYGDWSPVAWRPDIIGRRLIAWATSSHLVLASGDMIYRSAVLNAMARQTRHLRANLDLADPGPPQVSAATGMVVALLLLPGMGDKLGKGLRTLQRVLGETVYPDGGPVTRCTADSLQIARELISVKFAFGAAQLTPPDWLQITLDRMIPFIRAVSHGDHLPAQFNGAYGEVGPDDPALAERTGAFGRAATRLPDSGYERIKRWRTCVIVDAAPPPPTVHSRSHHAAPLAMELSDGKDRIIVNMGGSAVALCGPPDDQDGSLADLCRTSAAHSTLIVGDTNACELRADGLIGHGPAVVEVTREESENGIWLEARHDGYMRRWGLVHRRKIYMNAAGTDVRGEDIVEQHKRPSLLGPKNPAGKTAQVRFHLAPNIAASPTREGGAIILRLPHGHGWLFRADGGSIDIEESLYVPRPEAPRKTTQIVLSTPIAGDQTQFRWSFRRMDSKD